MTAHDALREARRDESRSANEHLRAINRRLDGHGSDDETRDTLARLLAAIALREAAEERVAAERMGVSGPGLVALEGGR